MSVNVVWWNASRGNWDSGLLSSVFEAHSDVFIQHNLIGVPELEKAIVIVCGKPHIPPLREYLEKLKSGVVILTSEEDGYFDWKSAIPSHLEIWTQYFCEAKRGIKERLMLGAPNRINNYKINQHLEKKYLWSFIGQNQNPFRQACVDILKTLPDGFLHVADSFGGIENGVEYQEYLDILCQSKYVICPAGSMNADSFRLYEALETGTIPITDKRCPRDAKDFNYWKEVCPSANILTVNSWDELPDILQRQEAPSGDWWTKYKEDFKNKLISIANG